MPACGKIDERKHILSLSLELLKEGVTIPPYGGPRAITYFLEALS
jgi:hypothetical protein